VSAGTLALAGLTRRFGAHAAVEGVSLEVGPGELVALVGASGSGKTTTLRMVAGYEPPDAGQVMLDGSDITNVPPRSRQFGMVFQHYALFPHMSVEENVAFGLEARGVGKTGRRDRARRALATVGLAHAAPRAIQSLSGGEQQRVALARAFVIEPRVLLLDEPLSNLDPTLRRSMREELRGMLREMQVTALFVTHDQDDAFAVADRVALLREGRLLQVGSPEELYARPVSRGVAEFIGRSALVPAMFDGREARIVIGGVEQRVAGVCAEPNGAGGAMLAVLRPEVIALAASSLAGVWVGRVASRHFAGSSFTYRVTVEGGVILEVASAAGTVREGETIGIRIATAPVALVTV
jgi:putative spermidine/putrescine transport system ATP-binding protein